MVKKIFAAFLGVALPGTVWASTVSVSSQNIKSILNEKNAKVSGARLSQEAAVEREGSLKRSFLPEIELQVAQESFKTGTASSQTQPTYGAEVRLNLFNGGQDQIESEVRQLEVEKRRVQVQRVTSEELEKARGIYWQVLYLQEKRILLLEAQQVNKQTLAAALKRIRGGVATDSDRFEFEIKEVDLAREIAEIEVELKNQQSLLKLILGEEESVQLSLAEPFRHDHDYEKVLQVQLKDSEFLFKETELQAEQLRLSSKGQSRGWWPKLDAYAAYRQLNESLDSAGPGVAESDRRETVIGLKMTMSLMEGVNARRESRSAAKEALSVQTMAQYQKRETEWELKSDMENIRLLHNQIHDAEGNIQKAESYYRLSLGEYRRGVKGSPDILGAAEKLFERKVKRLEIIRDFQQAKSHILSKMGQ